MIHHNLFLELANRTGYEDTRSLQFLHHLVKSIQSVNVLELGTAFGASAAFMAAGIKNGLLVSIDNYSGDYAKTPDEVIESLKILDLDKRVKLLKGNTHHSAAVLQNAGVEVKFDILFMDADHSYKGLKKEYNASLQLLAEEHIVIVDDSHIGSYRVRDFVAELAFQYAFCILIKNIHWGMAVFCMNNEQMIKVANALEEVNGV